MNDAERQEWRRHMERIHRRFAAFRLPAFECGQGWFPILEDLFEDVENIIPVDDWKRFSVDQIKEKFAGLRVYWGFQGPRRGRGGDVGRAIELAVFKAECRAAKACESCGTRGVLRRLGGWYQVRCDVHAEGYPPEPKERRGPPTLTVWEGTPLKPLVYEYDERRDEVKFRR